MPDEKVSRARGVDRVIDIFRQLHIAGRPMALRELIEATGAPRSSVYDLVGLLNEAGLVELNTEGAVFFGREMHYYGADYMAHNDLIRRAHQLMVEIVHVTAKPFSFVCWKATNTPSCFQRVTLVPLKSLLILACASRSPGRQRAVYC